MKIDWKAKLSSRKLWAALAGVVTALMAAFGIGDMTIAQVASVLSAVGVLAAYILGESMVDKAKILNQPASQEPQPEEETPGAQDAQPAEEQAPAETPAGQEQKEE